MPQAQELAQNQYDQTFGSEIINIKRNYKAKKLADVKATALTESFTNKKITKISEIIRSGDIIKHGKIVNIDREGRDLEAIDFMETMSRYLNGTTNINKSMINTQLKIILGRLVSGGTPYIIGIPGTGKTWTIQNYFKALIEYLFSDMLDGNVVVETIIINASASVPQDITGEQAIDFASGGKFSRYIIGETMKEVIVNTNTISIIFLDEINRAQPDMIAACMKLIDGELNPNYKMPVNSVVIAAGNLGEEDGTDCISFDELDSAIKDRFGVPVLYTPDFPTWFLINSTGTNIDPELIDVVKQNQSDIKTLFFGSDVNSRIMTPRRLTAFLRELTINKKLLSVNELLSYIDIYFHKRHIDNIYDMVKKDDNSNNIIYTLKHTSLTPIDQALHRWISVLKSYVSSSTAKLALHDPNTFIDKDAYIKQLNSLKSSDINQISNSFELSCKNNTAQFKGILRKYTDTKYKGESIPSDEKIMGLISDYATGLYIAVEKYPEFGITYLKAAATALQSCISFENSPLKSQIFNAKVSSKDDLTFKNILSSISNKKFLETKLLDHVPTIMFVALMATINKINDADTTNEFSIQIEQKLLAVINEEYDRVS